MTYDPDAALPELRAWAYRLIGNREPDFVIGPADDPQLERWHVVPRNPFGNVYLHRFLRSDDDRALHDHPWDNHTLVLDGCYLEHLESGETATRFAGDTVERSAHRAHRVEIIDGPAITLFFTGPVVRDWGFWCGPSRPGLAVGSHFVPWREFVDQRQGGNSRGRGCGE